MKKHTKLLFCLLCALVLCVTLCALSASAFADGDPAYTYDAATHTLTLTGGDYDKDHKWGNDLAEDSVYHVTAQTGVRFVGDCRNLFSGFYACKDMDLRNVDVSEMTLAWQMFASSGVQTLNVAGWDVSSLTDMNGMFNACRNLTTLDLSSWDVSKVTSMRMMFYNATSLTTPIFTGWDVSSVENMENMFGYCSGLTTLNLSAWNVSSVKTMNSMFDHCTKLSNLNVAGWVLTSVTNMSNMFQSCTGLTALDLSTWDVSEVTNMSAMFQNCTKLAELNIEGWNTAKLSSPAGLFSGCASLTELDLSGWNLYNIEPYYEMQMFDNMPKLCRLTLPPAREGSSQYPEQTNWYLNNGESGEGWVVEGTTAVVSGTGQYAVIPAPAAATTFVWNPAGPRYSYDSNTKALTLNYGDFDTDEIWASVPKAEVKSVTAAKGVRFVGDCSGLFYNFSACESMDLSEVDTSGMTNAQGLFAKCCDLAALSISPWNTAQVTDMSFMFQDCEELTSLNLTTWDTSDVADMEYMFDGCLSLSTLNVAGWDTSSVTNMEALFQDCYELTALDLGGWDTSSVTNMSNMFYSVSNELTALDLSAWDVTNVKTMDYMFTECFTLETLALPTAGISSVTDVKGMFKDCYALTALDLSGLAVTQMPAADYLFQGAGALSELKLPAGVGIEESMCLNNGDWHYPAPGWIVKGDASATVVSGEGDYAVIDPAEQATTYIWKFNIADHPNAVTAFDADGHWLYCPDCGRGLEGTYEEHDFDDYEDIDRVQITVPNSQAQSLLDLPADTPMGVGNTVQFINDEDEMSFTYLPDDSGVISCRDDDSESLYLPGGFETTPDDPYPAFSNTYAVMVPGASMDMWVSYEDCGYGVLEIGLAHGDKGKIWADKWFAKEGETVTFGVGTNPGYGCRFTVKCGNKQVSYAPGEYKGEYTFSMAKGNVAIEPSFYELPALYLPENTLSIQASAFENCGAMVVYVNDGCTEIGANAFKDCKGLEVIHIPASVTEIDGTAFDGCDMDLWIYGEKNSAAEAFCRTHRPHFHEEGTEW